MYHPIEVTAMIKKETGMRDKHIEILKKQNEELQYTVTKLREELGRSGKTTWVESDV
jgi:hypothetical protein|tara:strand:+ start:54 stop:224 length:171 start_codon:yes stop_codon:yes gene_type:complete